MQWRGVRRARGARGASVSSGRRACGRSAGCRAAGCSSLPSNGRASLASARRVRRDRRVRIDRRPAAGRVPQAGRQLSTTRRSARQIAVVSRDGAATYRVRGYVAAQVERGKTTFAWVWDVYDADKRADAAHRRRGAGRRRPPPRRLGRRRRAVLRRMARDGMDRLAGFLNASGAPPPQPEPSWRRWCRPRRQPGGGRHLPRVRRPDQPAGSARRRRSRQAAAADSARAGQSRQPPRRQHAARSRFDRRPASDR